jgi:tRNA A-37 threonylcarbamoyl transferase component Bud32
VARQARGHVRGRGIATELTLLARGRDADVYAIDDSRVLRRYRRRRVPDEEIRVMRHARAHGYPVPAVMDADGRDLVLERLHGQTMQEVLEAERDSFERNVRLLAALHERLHRVDAPEGIGSVGPGGTLLHLDLHPNNVILTADGPFVIDWANARSGHWADDVAQTIAIAWSALADPSFAGRESIVAAFVETFVASFDRATVRTHIGAAVDRRVADANVTDAERAAVRAQKL